ncbi:hypothetical protein RG963_06855 [Methanosarcina sp. Z-7115]|uniref:Uncharacterized protein n=1 Tax=Methanosarcina baikalica TaxID=3073890 RepID=A0ABU2D0X6_9EURY|nr:hypothetical protein [Methanosarcina sp. Z-7115]MDR7665502.1 hypothetical protein [Methanosarcina sp. Z-7115]
MLPYRKDTINSILDVQKRYPGLCDSSLLSLSIVKKFVKEELKELVEDELDRCEWAEEKAKPINSLEFIYTDIARARAIYHFLWSVDSITDQAVKWHWQVKDVPVLMKRMKAAGYNPWSTTEPTTGQYIESLPGYGRKEVKTKSGRTFHVYNPKGYGEEETAGHDYEED